MKEPEVHNCINCNWPMDFVKFLRRGTRGGTKCRIRQFSCSICGHIEAIYADGKAQEYFDKVTTQNAVDKLYKEQESNNERL